MKRLFTYMICLVVAIGVCAQVDVVGTVVEKDGGEPVPGASVIIRGTDGRIKKFSTTKADGGFNMRMQNIAGCRLEVSMMGFARRSIPLDSVSFPLTVALEPGKTLLKEVRVNSARIREQGDTVTYNVGSFAQSHDRSIGDVLKRMPGIEVAKNGRIQYLGADISNFYIEGSDLLGGKYGIATNGISHNDVGAVEVMENHQPMQVLSGISFSDKAAINLRLKNKAKTAWTVRGRGGSGWSCQPEGALWDGELFAMAVRPRFQSITTLLTNNTGDELTASETDFFSTRRNTALSRYVGTALPSESSLGSGRTLFNRSFLVSTNNLWKLDCGEFKSNIDYSFDRTAATALKTTTYFLENGNRVITENRSGTEHENSLNGKFVFEKNRKTMFVNNTLSTCIDWDDLNVGTTGSISGTQSVRLPDYYVGNNFKMIKRFGGEHLVTFESRNEWESLPQTLRFNTGDGLYSQKIGDHAFYTHESAAYAFSFKGITLSLEGGVKGYWRSMNSDLPELPVELPGVTENVIHTNSLAAYATPKFEYWVGKVDITLNLPVRYAHYSFDKAMANRDEVYFSPSVGFAWKPNKRFSGALHAGSDRSPMNLNLVYPGLIMTDYRTLRSGVGGFYNSTSQNVSANLSYRQVRHGIFANAMILHSWNHVPYTLSQQLIGDYAVYSYADADNNSRSLMTMGSIGKTLDFIRGSINLNGSFGRSGLQLISERQQVRSVSRTWGVEGKIDGSPWIWFSFGYTVRYSGRCLTMNGISESWLSSLTNELSLNLVPHRKWQWKIGGEHFRNELAEGTYKNVVMLDTKLTYLPSDKLEISTSLTNILDKQRYEYVTYSQLSSFESRHLLRGRQFLLSITLLK